MFFCNNFFARFVQLQQSIKLSRNIIAIFFVTIFLVAAILMSDSMLRICYAEDAAAKNNSAESAEKIMPLVNDSTFMIAHINLTEINLQVLRKHLTKFVSRAVEMEGNDEKLKKMTLAEAEKLFNEIFPDIDSFVADLAVNAGLTEVYFVGALAQSDEQADNNLEPAFFLAVPYKINDQTDKNIVIRQKIEWVFRFLSRKLNLLETKLLAKNDLLLYPILPDNNNSNNSEEQNSDEQNNVPTIEYIDEEVQYENVDDVEDEVSGNSKNNVFDENLFKNYIDKFSATKNPYLVNAFKCSEGDFIKVVFLFGKPVKTFLLQLSAKEDENKQVTNIIRYITGQINYLSIGVDPLKSRLRAVAQAKNAASAKQVQNGLSGLTDWGVTFIDGSAAMFIAFSALPEEILPVISLVLEILRGVANYAIPACDKDNLKWNYEINPEKTSAEIAAGVVALACMLCIGTEESCTKLFAEWKEKMRPLLRIKNEIKRVTE